jgi:hypothetical protein
MAVGQMDHVPHTQHGLDQQLFFFGLILLSGGLKLGKYHSPAR